MENNKDKVVFKDVNINDIISNITINNVNIVNENDHLSISLDITNNNKLDYLPKDVSCVLDDCVDVDLFSPDDKKVGRVTLPLPLYGLLNGETTHLFGQSRTYIPDIKEYKTNILLNNLWLMEL